MTMKKLTKINQVHLKWNHLNLCLTASQYVLNISMAAVQTTILVKKPITILDVAATCFPKASVASETNASTSTPRYVSKA